MQTDIFSVEEEHLVVERHGRVECEVHVGITPAHGRRRRQASVPLGRRVAHVHVTVWGPVGVGHKEEEAVAMVNYVSPVVLKERTSEPGYAA